MEENEDLKIVHEVVESTLKIARQLKSRRSYSEQVNNRSPQERLALTRKLGLENMIRIMTKEVPHA